MIPARSTPASEAPSHWCHRLQDGPEASTGVHWFPGGGRWTSCGLYGRGAPASDAPLVCSPCLLGWGLRVPEAPPSAGPPGWTPVDLGRVRVLAARRGWVRRDWLLLTKRPEQVLRMVPATWLRWPCDDPDCECDACPACGEARGDCDHDVPPPWPAHVWIGATVEDQRRADERIPELLRIPAPVRFLSCEPLVGPVDLSGRLGELGGLGAWTGFDGPGGRLDWIIAGGESGPKARPSHPDWFRNLRDQCAAADVPFLFKQWGAWAPADDVAAAGLAAIGFAEPFPEDGGVPTHTWPDAPVRETAARLGIRVPPGAMALDTTVYRVGKRDAGRLLDGELHDGGLWELAP